MSVPYILEYILRVAINVQYLVWREILFPRSRDGFLGCRMSRISDLSLWLCLIHWNLSCLIDLERGRRNTDGAIKLDSV